MNDLEMMRKPGEWPRWPVLPLKREAEVGGLEMGLLIANKKPVIFIKNLFLLETGNLNDQLKDVPKKQYDSFEAIVAAGWIVD